MKMTKRILAMVLILSIVLSLAACGKKAAKTTASNQQQSSAVADKQQSTKTEDLSREEKELVVELMGNGEDTTNLSDNELTNLVDKIVNGGKEDSSAYEENKDAYNENGEMTKPFDQVYPELIEQEKVTFSGETILVKLKKNTLTAGLKAAGVGALEEIVPMEGCAWYEAKLVEGTDTKAALEAVRQLKEVLLAEFNYEVQIAALDDYKHFDKEQDEDFKKNGHNKDQWHFHHCGIPDGYEEMEKDGGDSSVVVAVIDSGVDYTHEDLKDNMWVNTKEIPDNGRDDDGNGYIDDYYGVDIMSKNGNGGDTNGHGTHVAGIIAARNNNVGTLGVAYNVKIMSVKAAAHNGTLNQGDIAKAVLYAYENGAEVINMSFGGSACSIAVQDALATAYTRCVLVASAGNSGKPNEPTDFYPALPNYPAALTYVLGVMSVDETGKESIFTNWDAFAFNGVEYELYAPGENIMSTLPGNKYGYLSGTSMAAPVVSAFAAILRSEFADRDKYPTKFIYGQLASTSGYYADCVNPQMHTVGGMPHNLPQIVNLNDALTKLPKPELNVQEYYVFDDPKYSVNNNGDGVIDAGETIALGLVIRNRWGMSENTLVTIDTLSQAGLSDPYFTIKNPTVNYGSVGTYSTQDCGKVYTDELFTGWENPFLIEVSKDCPNDYRFTLNVTITCENALDAEDETVYVSKGKVDENVRSGYILPSIIEEDMVLTKDNLYIIPNATIIQKGVTVRVEPGTHIQFWSDDANDPYADSYIAYLLVNGRFLVEGTKEEPVYIYPSQLMDRYGVEIGSSSTGYVSLKYADITNFFCYGNHTGTNNNINLADHCTFRYNYTSGLYYRYLSEGNVAVSNVYDHSIGKMNAKDCVFYKIAYNYDVRLHGSYDRCVFAQCGIKFEYYNGYDYNLKNCVFLGNALRTQSGSSYNSSLKVSTQTPSVGGAYYSPETGTTYVRMSDANGLGRQFLAEALKLDAVPYAIIETPEEGEELAQKIWAGYGSGHYYSVDVGIYYDATVGKYLWSDGTEINSALDPDGLMKQGAQKLYLRIYKDNAYDENGNYVCGCRLNINYSDYALFEIPGRILPTDITFNEYAVDMDLETTYQLAPQNTPVQLPADHFLYESTDETVITVSETGLVTPVGKGTADVWVYSADKAVKNRVTFTVRDYVALEKLAFPVQTLKLEMGKSVYAPCVLTPADTTRRNVTYTSSDPSVVAVDNGLLTAVGKGTATVTATCEGLTATIQVSTWVRATTFTYYAYDQRRTVESCDTSLPELNVFPANADVDLEWTSQDTSILDVENGKLVLKKAGSTYLDVVDKNSGKTTYFYFYITSTAPQIQKDVIAAQLGAESVALPEVNMAAGAEATPMWEILDPAVAAIEDGKIVFKGAGITTLRVTDPRSGLTDEIFIYVTEDAVPRIKELLSNNYRYHMALLEDGRLYRWYAKVATQSAPSLMLENVKTVSQYSYNNGDSSSDYWAALLEDGRIVTYHGTTQQYTYTLPEGMEPVKIAGYSYYGNGTAYGPLHVLTADGKVYAQGTNSYGMLGIGTTEKTTEWTQVAISEPVVKIAHDGADVAYFLAENGNLYLSGSSSLKVATPVLIARNVTWLDDHGQWFTANNKLYRFKSEFTEPQVQSGDFTGYTVLDMYNNYGTSSYNGIAIKDGEIYRLDNGSFYRSMTHVTTAIDGGFGDSSGAYYYVVTGEGMLFGCGESEAYSGNSWGHPGNGFLGMTKRVNIGTDTALFLPIVRPAEKLTVLQTNLDQDNVLSENTLNLQMNKLMLDAAVTITENGTAMVAHKEIKGEMLLVNPTGGWTDGARYTLTITVNGTAGVALVKPAEDIIIEFTYKAPAAEQPEGTTPEDTTPEATLPDAPEATDPVIYEAIVDETILRYWERSHYEEALAAWNTEKQLNGRFYGNAILNPVSTDFEVSHWLRPMAPTVSAGTYQEIPLGGNYWGSTNERAIGLQMIDYTDFITYARLMYAPYLTEAPENTFPFVTSVTLWNKNGEQVTTVGNEEITFRVTFNRDMDTTIPLLVRFGSAFPYGDYEIEGRYVDARTWEGVYTLNTLIENGYQYFTISNGCSATDDLQLQLDQYRFSFEIDTTAAQALIMQGTALDTGIELKWTQDDFKTLMGYNVYRSTKEDGLYTRLNTTVIPADTMEWFDTTVEPGVVYYYNFTVVQTDLTESEPSGKIVIMSRDTMAPNIYHSPVANAFTGSNLVISATVTDNLNIAYANLYYRIAGTEEWTIVRMNKLNDKYSAIIPANAVTVEGVEYYIEAFDGISFTYNGSAETPYTIAVQEAVGADALGDVDGDGIITNLDALLLLYTINDKYNMTAEEFARADLNGDGDLWAAEALRILQYVSGVVGSVKM